MAVTIGKNALSGAVSQGVYIVSRFVTVPIVVAHLGLGGYGIWAIIQTVAGYMRFGTAGIKSAFIKYVAEATGTGDYDRASKLVSTGSYFMLFLSLVGMIPVALFSRQMAHAAGVPPEFLSAAAKSITILAFTYLITNFGAGYEAVVMGGHRIDLTKNLTTIVSVLEAVAMVLVLHWNYGLVALSLVLACSQLVCFVACYLFSLRVLPQMKISLTNFTRTVFGELVRFAGSYQLLNLLELSYLSIWPIVLLRNFGPEAAGVSALASRVVSAVMIGQEAFCLPILSGGSMVFASGVSERITLFLAKAFKVTLLISVLPLAFVSAFGVQMIQAWTGETGPLFALTIVLISLSTFFKGISFLQLILYRSVGKALLDNIRQVLRIIAALIVAFFAKSLGFYGFLAGSSLAELAGVIFMFFTMSATFREFSLRTFMTDALRITAATAVIIGIGAAAGLLPLPFLVAGRWGAAVKLGEISLGCLLVAWPALSLTNAISPNERRTILQTILPGRRALAVTD